MVIPAGREAQAIGLLTAVGFERPLPGGLVWDSITIERQRVVFTLHAVDPAATGAPSAALAQIEAIHRDHAQPGDTRSRQLALRALVVRDQPAVRAAVQAALASMVANDRGELFGSVGQPSPWPVARVAFGLLALWLAGMTAWLVLHGGWQRIAVRFKATHLLPAVLQTGLFAYWSLYTPEVQAQLPIIGLQIAFGYAMDFVLGMTVDRRWDATFGPLPVVLSANLFVWFSDDSHALSFAVIAIAIASKWLVRRKGRHIFNPSAFGVASVGLACLLLPEMLRYQDIAHLFALPPQMLAAIGVVSLIAQARVPIALVSVMACATLLALHAGGLNSTIYPLWPAVLLALTLLLTDPATIPQTGMGRALFGTAAGLALWACSAGLTLLGERDFFGKVLPIPLLNLLVPWFDRVAAAFTKRLERLPSRFARLSSVCEPRWNVAHMALWLAILLPALFTPPG